MVGVIGISSRKDIIGNIGADIVVVVTPIHRGRHAADLADLAASRQLPPGVDVALDIIRGTVPLPGCAESYAVVGCAVQICALGSRTGCVFSP